MRRFDARLIGVVILGLTSCNDTGLAGGDGGVDDMAFDAAVGDVDLAGFDLAGFDFTMGDMRRPASSITFDPAIPLGAGTDVRGIAIADFNTDGLPDIATSNHGSKDVSVILSTVPGEFGAPKTTPASLACHGIAAAELTRDGKIDVAVGCVDNTSALSVNVFPGKGDGTLDSPVSYPVGPNPPYYGEIVTMRAVDVTADARLDLVFTHAGGASPALVVLAATANGSFTGKPPYTSWTGMTYPRTFALGQFNTDSNLDLVVADSYAGGNPNGGRGHFVPGNGDGTFGTDVPLSPHGGTGVVSAIAVGDVNNDTKPDLVFGDAQVNVLTGNGDGTFNSRLGSTASGSLISDIALADFDNDGDLDVAVANITAGTITVLSGAGNGRFTFVTTKAAGTMPFSLAIADFNTDGRPDIAVASGDGVQVFLNTSM